MDAGAILSLGRKLVCELELEHTCETLSKWMAHYLAEQMSEVESAKSQRQREVAQSKCCEIILRIWEKRRWLPGSAKPLGHIEEALKALIAMQSKQNGYSDLLTSERSADDNPWFEFTEKTHDIESRMLRISFLTGLLENNFGAEKQWVYEHGDALSEDERKLIQSLDSWFNLKLQFSTETDSKSKEKLPPKERADLVLQELDALLQQQSQAFHDLKLRLSQQTRNNDS